MLLTDYAEIDLDVTPSEEKCVQVSSTKDYFPAMRREANVFLAQIRRQFGDEPDGCHLRIKREDHDFGPYLSLIVKYEADNPEAVAYALKLEGEFPEHWDEEAKRELAEYPDDNQYRG